MVIITAVAGAAVILVLGLLFFLANGARVRNGQRDVPAGERPMKNQKDRATGLN